MKTILFTSIIFCSLGFNGWAQSFKQDVLQFQEDLNKEFTDPEESPLSKQERKKFNGHNFFPIDEAFRVKAKFIKTQNPISFQMKTSTDRMPTYDKYGEAVFTLKGREFKLNIYQSHKLRETEEYKDYLFLPFTDLTNVMKRMVAAAILI